MGKAEKGKAGAQDPQIIAVSPAYEERERKYVPKVPDDVTAQGADAVAAYKREKLLQIVEYVRGNSAEFVTDDNPALAPSLPPGMPASFRAPEEITAPRERVYFVDPALRVSGLHAEFRQETGKSYGVKQTVKLGGGAHTADPTLDRRELQAKLAWLGINLDAVENREDREWLRANFNSQSLKPGFRMISQRLRISYYPEGNTDVQIELACDFILIGETVFGRTWQDPKLEIELKHGPDDPELSRRILEREEQRLMARFGLERQLESNAVMGYRMLEKDLQTAAGQELMNRLAPNEQWWRDENRPGLKPE